MVWFLVALVLLVAALTLLWLDARGRRGAGGSPSPAVPVTGDDDEVAEQPNDDEAIERAEPPEPDEQAEFPEQPEPVELAEESEQAGESEQAELPEQSELAEQSEPTEARSDEQPGPAGQSKLTDRVRRLLPRRGPDRSRSTVAAVEPEPADPLADSPVVRWLETREFAPTQTPAPDFRHGDFAGGLPSLGTVSHGMFRGRRAIMGVAGGRAVLALQRDTASDVVLDLSRPDVDVEPGFHDAGEVAALEARTSDYGRLELVDRERLTEAARGLPADVRRVWAESEWVAATVDGAENPATWDDTVVALFETADVLAPLPPVGGRARPLPAEIDPGAPGSAAGPDADPAGGIPDPTAHRPPAAPAAGAGIEAGAVSTDAEAVSVEADSDATDAAADVENPDGPVGIEQAGGPTVEEANAPTTPAGPRRSGHLRLVSERPAGVRDLADKPVVADRGDADADADSDDADSEHPAEQAESTEHDESTETEVQAEPAEPVEPPETDPFDQIMEPTGPVASRGDVAADHLETRPPLSRPSRGAGHTYPEDASVPPLASGATAGEVGIKPLGSDDDEDEIRSEVERFDAARTDGRSDLEPESTGRHGSQVGDAESAEDTGRLSVADLAAKVGAAPSGGRRRRRQADPDSDGELGEADPDSARDPDDVSDEPEGGRERPGSEPDVERTMRIRLPKDSDDPDS